MTENSTLLDLQKRLSALEGGSVQIQTAPVTIQQPVTRPAPIQPEPIQPKEQAVIEQPKAKEEDLFTPPPMSKKPDGKDIGSIWHALLSNIKSPSTQALLKLATPQQISEEGVVLTFKNERLVSQINDSNKKQLIVDAANAMFGKTDIHVTIRLAQSGDMKSVAMPTPEPPKAKPVEKSAEKPVAPPVEKTVAKEPEAPIKETQPQKENTKQDETDKKKIERIETDQEKMVMDLFDGKYVE